MNIQSKVMKKSKLSNQKGILSATVAMAIVTAITYIFMALGLLGMGNITAAEKQKVDMIFYVAAGSYFLGAMLIFARRRWLWIAGAVMNLLVIAMYLKLQSGNTIVLMSSGGLSSKLAQLLLELGLIYLIATYRKKDRMKA
jgi:hypothetical protein